MTTGRAAALVAVLVAGASLLSLRGYGVTFDEPSLLYAGDRTVFFVRHPRTPGALDYNAPEPPDFHSAFARWPNHFDPIHYPVLPGFVAALSSRLLHERLGWLGVIDGHHAGLVLLNAVSLFLFCWYACNLLGGIAGVSATIALALYPTAVSHSFNDAKDWPSAMLYGLTILSGGLGILRAEPRHVIASAVFLAASMACKANAAFAAATLLVWFPIGMLVLRQRALPKPTAVRLIAALLVAPILAFALWVLVWPWLWSGGPSALVPRIKDYYQWVRDYGITPRTSFTDFPLRCLVTMSPPLLLVASSLGLVSIVQARGQKLAAEALVLLWLVVPLLRIAWPHSNFYDANRHFIEYIPALCALGGSGVAAALEWIRARAPIPRGALVGAAIASCAALAWPVVEYHPYEGTYFNFLVGGLGEAQRRALFKVAGASDLRVWGTEGDYWNSSVRDGVREAFKHVAGDGLIGICGWPQTAVFNVDPPLRQRFVDWNGLDDVPVIYVLPREGLCGWEKVRKLESERPILKRVERGGGLIYEVLGGKSPVPLKPVSPPSRYMRDASDNPQSASQ